MGTHTPARGITGMMADINVTPMVDVMLVLLIIFMVLTPAIVAGFQAQLPDGSHLQERPELEHRVVLGIDAQGRYYLQQRQIPREAALALLEAEFAARPDDRVLFLKADRALAYYEIEAAMDLAERAGARVVAAMAETKKGERGVTRR